MTVPGFIDATRTLIGLPSVSSVHSELDQGNRQVVEELATWFADLGFAVEIMPVSGEPDKANLIATLGEGHDGLVLAGHTDTVPWDEGRWNQDPFTLSERDHRLYGLGTSDMKGFFAVILEAIRDLRATDLKRPLIVLATADEESTMSGARALVEQGRRLGRHAVIGEPTGLKPVRMHKGILMEAIRVVGQSGHSSNPDYGANALEGMHEVIARLLAWRRVLQQAHRSEAFEVPVPTMNLGHIHGGDNPNRICGHCELQIDLRPLPGMELDGLRGELAARLREPLDNPRLEVEHETLFGGVPAMETAADSAIVQAAEAMTGHRAGAVAFGTEGPFLNQLGMQTLILGPGDIDQAHQPDEFLALERIEPMVDILRKLIRHFCIDVSDDEQA